MKAKKWYYCALDIFVLQPKTLNKEYVGVCFDNAPHVGRMAVFDA